MKKRTKLRDRALPDYTKGEEVMNMVTHIVGGGIGILVLVLCVMKAAIKGNAYGVVGSSIYGGSMVVLYANRAFITACGPAWAKKYCRCWITASSIF